MQPGHPPLVLVFHVALRAEAHDDDGDLVLTGAHVGADVVLARQPAVSAVAGERTVHPHRVHALRAADVQHGLPAQPHSRDGERAPVDTGGVAIGQHRGRTVERHLHVRVVRRVADVLHRPVAGHGHLGPSRRRTAQRRGRHRIGVIEQTEPPAPVQRASISGADGCGVAAAERQPVERQQPGVGPRPHLPDVREHVSCAPTRSCLWAPGRRPRRSPWPER